MKIIGSSLVSQGFVYLACACAVWAQAPTGTIAGVARDPSGAAVAGAHVKLTGRASGFVRTVVTSEQGDYSFPALLAGEYEVSVESSGFQRMVRQAAAEAGVTTTTDFNLRVGDVNESVTVDGASPQMRYDSNTVGGLVTQSQIQGLPLNGRSFLELAKLEPGVQAPTRATNNRAFVPVLGAPNSTKGQRVTVDGGSIVAIGYGGSAMGFSQEVVQEFQVSTVNFDLSTGITDVGAINVVTRSGGNDLHGTGLYFFRDHKLAAYPALNRDLANPDPFFQRRQFGFALGGPIRRDRVFFFGNWERNEQRGVVDATVLAPDFARFSRVTPSPLFGDLLSVRLDGRISDAHTVFVRHSHDGSRAFGPSILQGGAPNAYPSSWTRQLAWADQSLLGLTSVFRPTLVNDLRFSYFFTSASERAPGEQDCPGCLGIGAPGISISQAGLTIGRSGFPLNMARQFHLSEALTWQRSTHRARFGADWEHHRGGSQVWQNEPAAIALFSPDQVRTYNALPQTPAAMRIPLPAAFRTLDDILQLPLQTVTVAVGDPRVPQENGGLVRRWNTFRLYFQDTWRLHRGLTLNYGLGWNVDRNINYDLRRPALLAPILGSDGLGLTPKSWTDFTPVLGLAWAPSSDGKTVIRAGGGLFYDFLTTPPLDPERAALGPPGLGRQTFPGTSILNTLPGIAGVPVGRALNFTGSPTLFTGANLMAILPAIRADEMQSLANADPTVQAIQVTKQFSGQLPIASSQTPSALHASLGVQREIARDFVLSADFAYRHFVHLPVGIDQNHFNSIRGPVIPVCTVAQRNDPLTICSVGQITVQANQARSTYKGLLLRAEKRFSHGFQVLGSYAYSSNTGTNVGNGLNLDNWLQSSGPLSTDFTQMANLAGVAQLPWRFELGLNFSYLSAPPLSAYIGGIDFNGDGTTGDLLPGTTVNAFNRGMGRADLERLVSQFNTTYALTKDSQGRTIPRLALPTQYAFGDNFHALDLRLSRSFVFRERWRLSLIGEVFNLYNAANLTGHSGDLTSAAFGQPTSRATQVFGSGGPRAFQVAMRVSF
jgi:Carboxypeptidase regulatory-like domain